VLKVKHLLRHIVRVVRLLRMVEVVMMVVSGVVVRGRSQKSMVEEVRRRLM
jgi:hypothetical protein